MRYTPDKNNVKLIGRTCYDGEILKFALSGTGFECSFKGKKLDIEIVGDDMVTSEKDRTRVAVYVNGERKVDRMVDENELTITAVDCEEETTATVRLIKLSECAMSWIGVKSLITDGTIVPTPEAKHKIEIIGDSITCGYGVDDEVPEHHFVTATEDFTRAYAYKTATALGADYSAFSISGYGIISGYTEGETPITEQTIPQYYESLGFSYGTLCGEKPQNIKWDFSSFTPDLIIINLGTNDASYCKNIEERNSAYSDGYVEFLKKVRKNNPNPEILCILGIMDERLCETLEKTVSRYTEETGDSNISTLMFKAHDGTLGYAADWHPTEKTHDAAAERLIERVKSILSYS